MIKQSTKELLQTSKNLLAFSAGVDSSALFFILKELKIPFDIAIVDYALRDQSKEEVLYAKELADRYEKKCFVKEAEEITKNFEATARAIRYTFFEELIKKHNYDNLLTAHHLGDRFEWFLMQFCKGAGCAELSGMQEIEEYEEYRLVRPLLDLDKNDLLAYLQNNAIHYFEDASNNDEKYKRNYFRHHHTQALLERYKSGIKKSFEYIDKDKSILIQKQEIKTINKLALFLQKSSRSDIYHIDKYLKSIGHIITKDERELLEKEKSVVIGRKYIVSRLKDHILIAPYYTKTKSFTKTFKEKMRELKVDPKLRPYLAEDEEALLFLSRLFS